MKKKESSLCRKKVISKKHNCVDEATTEDASVEIFSEQASFCGRRILFPNLDQTEGNPEEPFNKGRYSEEYLDIYFHL